MFYLVHVSTYRGVFFLGVYLGTGSASLRVDYFNFQFQFSIFNFQFSKSDIGT